MITLEGKYNTATIHTDTVEESAKTQIQAMLDSPAFAEGNIAIMPDVHFGKGSVIGFTAPLGDKVIPNIVGVDLGCGITSFKLGPRNKVGADFQKLDDFIRSRIPSGMNVRDNVFDIDRFLSGSELKDFENGIKRVCKEQDQDLYRVMCSIGSLGGGNHFIEVNVDQSDNLWLTIHSGSRNFGLKIAQYHQSKAVEKMGKMGGLEYLEGAEADAYLKDMKLAQDYASLNRKVMGWQICRKHYKVKDPEVIESVHNYINFEDNIVRKGAISAHEGEKLIIPLNMRDGSIIAVGKGNAEWNNSAPHGAGRLMSRGDAKRKLSLDQFQRSMKDVWSSCVHKSTLDEAPMAYKNADDIVKYVSPTVDILEIIKPVYNFKA